MNKLVYFLLLICSTGVSCQPALTESSTAMPVAVIGLTHTHVHWILGRENQADIELVGIVETNQELARRYAKQHGFSMDIVFSSMDELFANTRPVYVMAFGSIREHEEVVRQAAPRGVHVMVEKPLALDLAQAKRMQALAEKHNIRLMTNYETSWYPTTHHAMGLLGQGKIGELRKVIIRDGHKGPKKLGINQEFLDWLLDPAENGGGAITDFGCYGANLLSWLLQGQRPSSVTAVTQQLQKENNPLVDDEATIILTYDKLQAIIQGSWNWPIGRKDMELYGLNGVIYADDKTNLRVRLAKGYDDFDQTLSKLEERPYPYNDPFAYFKALIEGNVQAAPYDLSSLENNLLVMEILDAARQSAQTGKTVKL